MGEGGGGGDCKQWVCPARTLGLFMNHGNVCMTSVTLLIMTKKCSKQCKLGMYVEQCTSGDQMSKFLLNIYHNNTFKR